MTQTPLPLSGNPSMVAATIRLLLLFLASGTALTVGLVLLGKNFGIGVEDVDSMKQLSHVVGLLGLIYIVVRQAVRRD